MRNRPEVIATAKANLLAKNYWYQAPKTGNTHAKEECDAVRPKDMDDDLKMKFLVPTAHSAERHESIVFFGRNRRFS